MPSLILSGAARAALLLALMFAMPIADQAIAASKHNNNFEPNGKAAPIKTKLRIAASSESYELSGVVEHGTLSLQLKRSAGGTPVTDAHIELTIDGVSGEAQTDGSGGYTYRSATLNKDGEREVIIAIKEGEKSDLLIGTLRSTDDHKGHAGKPQNHDGHGHDGHEGENVVKLTPEVMREFGVTTEEAGPGVISHAITRSAEISFNMDRFAHVIPRVTGIAKSISASQGQAVKIGQVLAVLESRELAELKAAYLAASERLVLAKEDFDRFKALRDKQITSEKSYLTSRTAFAEARIAVRSAKQKLNSIGIGDEVLQAIAKAPDSVLTQYTLRAPMGGMIVKRHLVQGELVTTEREAFTIADTSSVWINISLYSSDIPKVDTGKHVALKTENGHAAEGTISFVSPDVSEQTRTATARVVLKGASRNFRPGMFIKASIKVSDEAVAVRIPKSALQNNDGREVVFVNDSGQFKPRPVKIGRRNGKFAEVVSGLRSGEVIAAKNAFLIKAQLSKASFDDGHNH